MLFYNGVMHQIGIRELNQQTSQVVDRVRAGETMEITERGVPVAEIGPVRGARSTLARLVAQGRLTPPTVDLAVALSYPLTSKDDVNVADLLAADRDEERW